MPQFKITGADRESGEPLKRRVRADSPEQAEKIAQKHGIMVSRVEEIEETPARRTEGESSPINSQPAQPAPRQTSSRVPQAHPQRWIIMGAALLGIISTFLPWMHVPVMGAIFGSSGDGWFSLAFFLAAAALVWFWPVRNEPMSLIPSVIAGLLATAGGGVAVLTAIQLRAARAEGEGAEGFGAELLAGFLEAAQLGVGVYTLILAALVTLAGIGWWLRWRSMPAAATLIPVCVLLMVLGPWAIAGVSNIGSPEPDNIADARDDDHQARDLFGSETEDAEESAWEVRQRERDQERQRREAEREERRTYFNADFVAWEEGDWQDRQVFQITNQSGELIRSFQGHIRIEDQYDEHLINLRLEYDDPIDAGETIEYEGSWMMMGRDGRRAEELLQTRANDLSIVFEVSAVEYDDGTTKRWD